MKALLVDDALEMKSSRGFLMRTGIGTRTIVGTPVPPPRHRGQRVRIEPLHVVHDGRDASVEE